MFVFPQNVHVEGPIPTVMAFGGCLGLDKVTSIGPHDGLGVLADKQVLHTSLQPHGLQHTRLLCPPLSPGGFSNSCPLSQ